MHTYVIESNDSGQVVCNGLYHDFEYENMHVSSSIKANALGTEMTRKVKRLGCSAIKDLLETEKLTDRRRRNQYLRYQRSYQRANHTRHLMAITTIS